MNNDCKINMNTMVVVNDDYNTITALYLYMYVQYIIYKITTILTKTTTTTITIRTIIAHCCRRVWLLARWIIIIDGCSHYSHSLHFTSLALTLSRMSQRPHVPTTSCPNVSVLAGHSLLSIGVQFVSYIIYFINTYIKKTML